MLDKENNYIIRNYQRKTEFSSFLPGISGPKGIPMWCYYTNRGQAVSCFGVRDKDHSIMEFYPAHQAYERTPILGFRTFLKINGICMEAFSDPKAEHVMKIGMNHLIIEEETEAYRIKVEYETLPMEPLAGLMRSVSVTMKQDGDHVVEFADGMPEILPYGVTATAMKEMGQTAKAWMEVRDYDKGLPKFKVRASMEDSAEVTEVTGINFAIGNIQGAGSLPVIVDRNLLFQFDSALKYPYGMEERSIEELLQEDQVSCNDVACCFFVGKAQLKKEESVCIQEIYGMAEEMEAYDELCGKFLKKGWFCKKQKEAVRLAEAITDRIDTKTGNQIFDAYCRQSYLDNLLRGGYPIRIGKTQMFYLYSRKHGDMERDYNFFSMLPEYFSQGNGNFRDVNQNRRCDVQFFPFVGDSAIKTFYNAIQINGYNPLVIEKIVYKVKEEESARLKEQGTNEEVLSILSKEFTPGRLYRALEKQFGKETDTVFANIMDQADRIDRTSFGEGHWSDHWTYNLDLIESYLSVFPEKEKTLFYQDETYRYSQAEMQILPRAIRYVKTEKGIRQYTFLKKNIDTSKEENRYLKAENGEVIQVSLMTKLFTLLTNKISALDPYAMGIEMEGGKPGWYDALNGLPGLLGSSMAEAYETLRMIRFMKQILQNNPQQIRIPKELYLFQEQIQAACETMMQDPHNGQEIDFWNAVNDAKEAFWEETAKELSGKMIVYTSARQMDYVNCCMEVMERAVQKAKGIGREVCPTYFYYEVKSYKEDTKGIQPLSFTVRNTPDFLEGSVHALKLAKTEKEKKEIYDMVKRSSLYDRGLHMYKVNASLCEATFELGRACAFTPGWLENESVWLHMEYKYLLELLKAGMYEQFEEDFYHAAIPFQKEEIYGRSLLENSSFIASSVNANSKIRGKGFVARLSGSTAEFLQIWQILMFGSQPFTVRDGKLTVCFRPFLPKYIIGGADSIRTTFLGSTEVEYELHGLKELIPGKYQTEEIRMKDGSEEKKVRWIDEATAQRIRNGEISNIKVVFAPCEMGK